MVSLMAVLPSSLQNVGHGRGGAVSFVAWVLAGTFSRVPVLNMDCIFLSQ
jgi:hypothetical protein